MQVDSKTKIIKSPLNFTGGKYKLLPQLLPLFPDDISTFVDLFCGGCNVALNVNAQKIICNDNDEKLIGLLSFLSQTDFETLFPKIKKVISDFNLSDSATHGYDFYKCNSANGLGSFNRTGFNSLREQFNSLSSADENYFLLLYVMIVENIIVMMMFILQLMRMGKKFKSVKIAVTILILSVMIAVAMFTGIML